ncbi:hypothetical protein EP227_00680, partial [bacterium]
MDEGSSYQKGRFEQICRGETGQVIACSPVLQEYITNFPVHMTPLKMKHPRNRKKNTYRVGFHTSIANGISQSIERAVSLGCTTMQIFSHNPRQWRQSSIPDEEVQRFKILRKIHDINPVFIHASYLINLASLSRETLQKSIELLSYELRTADTLGIEYVVLHTGSAGGAPEQKA